MRTQAVAQEFGHSTVEPEHLLVALLEQTNGPWWRRCFRWTPIRGLAAGARAGLARLPRQEQTEQLYLGPRGRRVMQSAVLAANQAGQVRGAEHLFLALMAEGAARSASPRPGSTPERGPGVQGHARRPADGRPQRGEPVPGPGALHRGPHPPGAGGEDRPVIGRQDEILRTMEVLSGAPRTTRS